MTKEITKAHILQEIQDKFQLRELMPEKFAFSEMVIPTYDVGQHLTKPQIKHATMSITSGPTAYYAVTVPGDEKWHLHGYNVIFMTGSYKVAGLMVYRSLVADYFYIDLTKNQIVSYAVILPKDVILVAGNKLYLYVDDYTTTGNLELRIDVTVEEIR